MKINDNVIPFPGNFQTGHRETEDVRHATVLDEAPTRGMVKPQRSYTMAETEYAKAEEWSRAHAHLHDDDDGVVRIDYAVRFTPNGIGQSVEISCPYCGDKLDVTDFDLW